MRTGSFGTGRSRSLGFGAIGVRDPGSGLMRDFFKSRRGLESPFRGERPLAERFFEERSTGDLSWEDTFVDRFFAGVLFEDRDVFFGLEPAAAFVFLSVMAQFRGASRVPAREPREARAELVPGRFATSAALLSIRDPVRGTALSLGRMREPKCFA